MPFNVGTLCDMAEMYIGEAGVDNTAPNRELLWRILNMKLNDFASRTGVLQSKATLTTSDADGDGSVDSEYELPDSNMKVRYVDFNSLRIEKTTHEKVRLLQGNY